MATKTNTSINGRDYFRIRRTIDGVQKNFYGRSKTEAERKYREYLAEVERQKYEYEDLARIARETGKSIEEVISLISK